VHVNARLLIFGYFVNESKLTERIKGRYSIIEGFFCYQLLSVLVQ